MCNPKTVTPFLTIQGRKGKLRGCRIRVAAFFCRLTHYQTAKNGYFWGRKWACFCVFLPQCANFHYWPVGAAGLYRPSNAPSGGFRAQALPSYQDVPPAATYVPFSKFLFPPSTSSWGVNAHGALADCGLSDEAQQSLRALGRRDGDDPAAGLYAQGASTWAFWGQ